MIMTVELQLLVVSNNSRFEQRWKMLALLCPRTNYLQLFVNQYIFWIDGCPLQWIMSFRVLKAFRKILKSIQMVRTTAIWTMPNLIFILSKMMNNATTRLTTLIFVQILFCMYRQPLQYLLQQRHKLILTRWPPAAELLFSQVKYSSHLDQNWTVLR